MTVVRKDSDLWVWMVKTSDGKVARLFTFNELRGESGRRKRRMYRASGLSVERIPLTAALEGPRD